VIRDILHNGCRIVSCDYRLSSSPECDRKKSQRGNAEQSSDSMRLLEKSRASQNCEYHTKEKHHYALRRAADATLTTRRIYATDQHALFA